MKIHHVAQGSPEWLSLRAKHYCASDAPAMLGLHPNATRSEMLRIFATGDERSFSDWTAKNLLERGHAIETSERVIAEQIVGRALKPCVATETVKDLPLLASFDGRTEDGQIVWENKTPNKDLLKIMDEGDVFYHWPQLEHQLLVSGATGVYFTAGDSSIWYESKPERRQAVLDGWKQFAQDLKDWKPESVAVEVVGAPVQELPALFVQIEGRIVASNLDVFRDAARVFIKAINTDLQTDQDFADAAKMVTFCEEGAKRLELVKSQALAQTATIDELFRTIDEIKAGLRSKRLELDKLIESRKSAIRSEILQDGLSKLDAHIDGLNARLGGHYLRASEWRDAFPAAMKGKRTVASLREAVTNTLATCKIAANEIADRIQQNLVLFRSIEPHHAHLFADLESLVRKAPDDFKAIVKLRSAEHDAAMQAKHVADQAKAEQEPRIITTASGPIPTSVTVRGPIPEAYPPQKFFESSIDAEPYLLGLIDAGRVLYLKQTSDTEYILTVKPEAKS